MPRNEYGVEYKIPDPHERRLGPWEQMEIMADERWERDLPKRIQEAKERREAQLRDLARTYSIGWKCCRCQFKNEENVVVCHGPDCRTFERSHTRCHWMCSDCSQLREPYPDPPRLLTKEQYMIEEWRNSLKALLDAVAARPGFWMRLSKEYLRDVQRFWENGSTSIPCEDERAYEENVAEDVAEPEEDSDDADEVDIIMDAEGDIDMDAEGDTNMGTDGLSDIDAEGDEVSYEEWKRAASH